MQNAFKILYSPPASVHKESDWNESKSLSQFSHSFLFALGEVSTDVKFQNSLVFQTSRPGLKIDSNLFSRILFLIILALKVKFVEKYGLSE